MNRLILSWTFACLLGSSPTQAADPVLISELGSERSTTGPGNNIVTHAGKTHVVWQECADKGYYNVIRTLDRASNVWSAAVKLGSGVDNHARPCIAIDSEGFLHVVLGGHNTMMFYCKSEKPNDSSAWTKLQPIDSGTYPMLICGPDDTLVLGARPKTHSGVNLYVRTKDQKKWETRDNVIKRNKIYSGYAGYNVSMAWGADKSLHFAADVYEGRGYTTQRGTHQLVVYMVSQDLGKTWKKADGSAITVTDSENMDVLAKHNVGLTGPAQGAVLRNGGVAVDSQGRPFVYFTAQKNDIGSPHLMMLEKGSWKELPLTDAFKKQWPDGQVQGARGHLTIDSADHLHVLVEFSKIPPTGTKLERFEGKIGVGLLTSKDGGKTFEARELIGIDAKRHYSQASLERQTGFNEIKGRSPGLIFTDGLQRYPEKGEVIQNKVYWLQP